MRAGRHFVMLVSMHMMQYNLSLSNIAQRIVKYLFFLFSCLTFRSSWLCPPSCFDVCSFRQTPSNGRN